MHTLFYLILCIKQNLLIATFVTMHLFICEIKWLQKLYVVTRLTLKCSSYDFVILLFPALAAFNLAMHII